MFFSFFLFCFILFYHSHHLTFHRLQRPVVQGFCIMILYGNSIPSVLQENSHSNNDVRPSAVSDLDEANHKSLRVFGEPCQYCLHFTELQSVLIYRIWRKLQAQNNTYLKPTQQEVTHKNCKQSHFSQGHVTCLAFSTKATSLCCLEQLIQFLP